MVEMKGENSWTKTQLVVFYVIILLTLDEVNPVKMFLHVFPAVSPWQIAVVCGGFMTYIFLSDVKDMLYFGIKIFFHSIISIFFRNVEIIGRDNIPRRGPVIFTINHANQFIDAVMVLCTCQLKLSYLMAEVSWNRRIIGDIAWALGVVPVKRAQDNAVAGTGQIHIEEPGLCKPDETPLLTIRGVGTAFTKELKAGDKVRPQGTAYALKVDTVASDTELTAQALGIPADFPFPKSRDEVGNYDILRRIPLTVVFQKVLDKLAAGGAIGIFPEGGSHDRTDLLPLKVGISLIAYSALETHHLNVPIVPVGLSYFGAHRWRGRAVVEYGRPIYIDPATLPDFKAGDVKRRVVCNDLMQEIEASMRSVLVSSPDYATLEMLHTARRLYQKGLLPASEKQDLSRRFTEGYKMLLSRPSTPPQEWLDLQDRLKHYQNELKDLGLKDHRVPALNAEHLEEETKVENVDGDKFLSYLRFLYDVIHLLVLLAVAAVPTLMLNLPVGVLAGLYAESRRKKALAKSKVKIRGYDVMLTEKVVFCIVMVPTLWITYGIYMVFFTNLDGPATALILMTMPVFAYVGIVVADAGMVDWKDLRPYLMRMLPTTRQRLASLPETRKALQDDLRAFIRLIGPSLGELYYGKEVDWASIHETYLKSKEEETKKSVESKKSK